MATPTDQRLGSWNQIPCDTWSTKEKLALATSVEKSGDQNWNSVSRSLKSFFPEDHRPPDWFHYKLCALQYRDMLDKTENPKRKRERNQETPTSLIVKKLTMERISELTKSIPENIIKLCELKADLEKLKSENCSEESLNKISCYVREKIRLENQELLEDQKWQKERQPKVLQLLRKHPKTMIKSSAVTTPVTEIISDTESKSSLFDNNLKRDFKDIITIPDRDTSMLSYTTPPSGLKSPRSGFEQVKISEKEIIQLDDSKGDVCMNENQVTSDTITIKTDIIDGIEIKDPPTTGASFNQDAQKETVKNEILLEQENSNDTIEETFENMNATKDEMNTFEHKNDSTRSTSKDGSESSASKADGTTMKDIKEEDDNSVSVDPNSSLLNVTDESIRTSPKEKMRRKRRRFHNASVMQTRSTRSQSHIKSEETKDIKAETSKGHGKKRSNSADESTSVDNTISEESNDGKSSTTESTQNDDVVDRKMRKSLNFKLSSICSHRFAHYFNQPQSDNYRDMVYQPFTLATIKQRIFHGQIKSDLELKRDLMLMFSNILNCHGRRERIHKSTLEMVSDTLKMFDPNDQKITRSRESRQTPEVKKVGRRKTRGSISLDKMIKKKN